MDARARQRVELGEFLRSRRGALSREAIGLPPVPRSRTTGLRREEVASFSGVSVTWYTWLEQGRSTNPSKQVLDSLARTLRLSSTEHRYLLSLSGHAVGVDAWADREIAPPQIQRLLDAMAGFPAFALEKDWRISAWNDAYAALYPNIATTVAVDRNLLWLVFMDPYIRKLLPDWEVDSRRFLAEFRADTAGLVGVPSYSRLIERLLAESAPFRAGWENRDIECFTSRERRFNHQVVGGLRLEHHQLAPVDVPDSQIVVYLPIPGTGTAERLMQLVGTR